MEAEGMETFERQVTELVAAAQALLKEFEGRIGESIHAQRVQASEARAEGVRVVQSLQELNRLAIEMADRQRKLHARIESQWQINIEAAAQRAGAEQARAFGQGIAEGLRARLQELTAGAEAATRRLAWRSLLQWGMGIALGIPLTVALGVWALLPSVHGVSSLKVRVAMTQIGPCQLGQDEHVCIVLDDSPRYAKGPDGKLHLPR